MLTVLTTISCLLGQLSGLLKYPFVSVFTVGAYNEGIDISYLLSLSDKGDRSDKESEKSSMKVIGRGLWKPCHSCHPCHELGGQGS